MNTQFSRTELLLGDKGVQNLHEAHVIVFGVGGVGGFTVEALARAGVGFIDIVDNDVVSLSNINRQIIALHSTIGKSKVQVMKERIADINPDAVVNAIECFFLPENQDKFKFSEYSYVVDAVDTVTAKIAIIQKAKEAGVPVISCMGAGNKLDPLMFRIADISETRICPLSRVVRQELKKCNIQGVKVLYSEEQPVCRKNSSCTETKGGHPAPGSISFVPSVAGLIIAGEVIKDLSAQ